MSTNEQIPLSQPTSVVRNTLGREQAPQNLVRPVSDEDLREYCDKNYHQILPIIAEKLHQEKLKAVKARLNIEEASQYSESETPNRRRNLKERLGPRYARTRSRSPEPRRDRSKSPREKDPERRTVFKRLKKGMFHRLGDKEKNVSAHSRGSERKSYYSSRRDTESCYQSSRSKETKTAFEKHRHRIEYSRKTKAVSESKGSAGGHWKSKPKKKKMPSHIKTYDGSEDPEDHLKIFQAAAKTERWAMPTWCHMFNSTLTGNARKKCIKDLAEIHNIKQRNRESTEEFVRKYTLECKDLPIGNGRSRFHPGNKKPDKSNFKRRNFQNEQRMERKQDRFTLLTKTPREILALDKRKFKPPPPMTTPVEKRNASKFCWKTLTFDQGIKAKPRKRSGKDSKEGGNLRKDKPQEILMVQPWQRIPRQRITQTFSPELVISFLTLREEDGTKGRMIIETKMGGHCMHRIYVDGGSSSEILYEHCFSKFRLQIKNQLIPANTPLVGFSGELIWPLGQISLLVRVGDEEHSTWLSNPVMVKKHDDGWRMCVDFKDLNKACPKNGYPLLEIDWKVESICGKINMKLNPKKCAFGMKESTFLGYKVDADELRVSPDKVKAVLDLPSPKCLKDVQKLNGNWLENEEVIMYLAAAKEAISAVLMTEMDGKQIPVYFVIRALQGPEINYTPMEKLILTLDTHQIHQWRTGKSSRTHGYCSRTDHYTLTALGAGLIITNQEGMEFTYALRFRFNATNNEAEYEALIAGLRIASQMGVQNLQANVDSKLVANQVNGIYIAKESSMI
nr:hypothetical protein [Tanacetum cinerariifolium]